MSFAIAPKETLYVHRLNEKVKKDELRKSLYELFSAYGRVLEVKAYKKPHLRGQAFVVFRDVASATTARRKLDGFVFYDQPMTVEFSKQKSFTILEREGLQRPFTPLQLNPSQTEPARKPLHQLAEFVDLERPDAAKRTKLDSTLHNTTKETNHQTEQSTEDVEEDRSDNQGADQRNTVEMDSIAETQGTAHPNHVLFIRNLPVHIGHTPLENLFTQYQGFREVRVVPGKSDMAFVEFESVEAATTAKQVLEGFEIIPSHPLLIEFAD